MKNFVQMGDTLTLTAPYDVASGGGALVGSIFGVATGTFASGAEGEFKTTGVFEMAKTSALAISVGDLIYWDNSAKVVNKTNTNKLVGVAVSAAANPSDTVLVRLNGAFIS
jgi:predicted RecA/RadA family phage recombinase